jgi:N-dimethylarginine dimethylaminohydrolase
MAIHLDVRDETAPLETVILGIGRDCGGPRRQNLTDARYHAAGKAPNEEALVSQVDNLGAALTEHGVRVIRPANLPKTEQIFARDLAFVVGGKLFWGNLKRPDRKREQESLRRLLAEVVPDVVGIEPPEGVLLEGGDVVLLNEKVFVGVGRTPGRRRTDTEAVPFLQRHLPEWEVIGIETRASDDPDSGDDPYQCILHLDCAFQPLGSGHAVIFEDGFTRRPEAIIDIVGQTNLISVSGDEMFRLWPNVLSMRPDTVVSSPSAARLNDLLRRIGLKVLEVPYDEVAKQGGSFRCSALPLCRKYDSAASRRTRRPGAQ